MVASMEIDHFLLIKFAHIWLLGAKCIFIFITDGLVLLGFISTDLYRGIQLCLLLGIMSDGQHLLGGV